MLTVDDYGQIRRAFRDGMSIREIARTFHHSRRKIREVLNGSGSPEPYRKRARQVAPKLGQFHNVILEILKEDEKAPRKQRHTMTRLHERLKLEHGYEGSYSTVRRFVLKHREKQRETFIPLDHEPGQRMEADFGVIQVDFPEGRCKVNVLILVWSFSNAPFAIAFPTQRTEAILEGMTQAFEFFGSVPKEVWWDNPKTVVGAVLSGRSRTINKRYAALASHYVFEPLFCLPARGNEKPVVENRVKTLQRRWSTPVPKMNDFEELNAYLRTCCVQEQERFSSGKRETIGIRLEQEKQHAIALPKYRFDSCIRREVVINKYQFAQFDNVSYSVPRHCAFQTVSVKGYVDRVEIVSKDAVVATHSRSYEARDQVLDPLHYLTTLERRPAALDHSNVYRHWKLPQVFDDATIYAWNVFFNFELEQWTFQSKVSDYKNNDGEKVAELWNAISKAWLTKTQLVRGLGDSDELWIDLSSADRYKNYQNYAWQSFNPWIAGFDSSHAKWDELLETLKEQRKNSLIRPDVDGSFPNGGGFQFSIPPAAIPNANTPQDDAEQIVVDETVAAATGIAAGAVVAASVNAAPKFNQEQYNFRISN